MKLLTLKARMAGVTKRDLRRAPAPKRADIKAVEMPYLADLRRYVKRSHDLVRQHVWSIVPQLLADAATQRGDADSELRTDTYLDRLNEAIQRASEDLSRDYPDERIKALAAEAAKRVDRFSHTETTKQVKAIAGIDVTARVPSLPKRINDFTADNVALIKRVSTGYLDSVRDTVMRGVRAGERAQGFSPEVVSDLEGVSANRAALIARDQVNKFNGELTRARQTDLGVDRYIWHNSDDERVRGNPGGLYPKARYSHWDREGQIYSWSDPPPDGHPGHPVNCRCWAEPVLDDVV